MYIDAVTTTRHEGRHCRVFRYGRVFATSTDLGAQRVQGETSARWTSKKCRQPVINSWLQWAGGASRRRLRLRSHGRARAAPAAAGAGGRGAGRGAAIRAPALGRRGKVAAAPAEPRRPGHWADDHLGVVIRPQENRWRTTVTPGAASRKRAAGVCAVRVFFVVLWAASGLCASPWWCVFAPARLCNRRSRCRPASGTVAAIVLTGAFPVLILLLAVEMAAQCISWTLGQWDGRVICKKRQHPVEIIVYVRLSIFKCCLICSNTPQYYIIWMDNIICLVRLVFCILLFEWTRTSLVMSVLICLFSSYWAEHI